MAAALQLTRTATTAAAAAKTRDPRPSLVAVSFRISRASVYLCGDGRADSGCYRESVMRAAMTTTPESVPAR